MISYLKGKPILLSKGLIIEVNGVGYDVKTSESLSKSLANKESAELYIYTHVREDKLELYGFETVSEKETFELVLGVSGVGPSIAINLISMGTDKLIEAVQNAQVSFFSAAPRVGKKLAQKIIIELRGKLGELKALDLGPKSSEYMEILETLTALGFAQEQVHDILTEIDLSQTKTQEAIKLAMKKLSK